MLVAVIVAPTLAQAISASKIAKSQGADLVEWRLDYLPALDCHALATFCANSALPVILTLRPLRQGGQYRGPESQRLALLKHCASANPCYLDVESDVPHAVLDNLYTLYPAVKLLRSYHCLDHTPQHLQSIYHNMQHPACWGYKLITHAHTTLDVLRMLHWVKGQPRDAHITGHCMGIMGKPSRILAPIVGSTFCYATLNNPSHALHDMWSLTCLVERYHIHTLNEHTKIYALLGDPVEHSQGDRLHNQLFSQHKHNAVYVKLKLPSHELPDFFSQINGLNFGGFSITMPLKTVILKQVHTLRSHCGAINTLSYHQHQWIGDNTDGIGAQQALTATTTLEHKHILILGAGGAARAIAYQLSLHTRKLTLANRTLKHAQKLADKLAIQACRLDQLPHQTVDIVINTLALTQYTPALSQSIQAVLQNRPIVMDICYASPQTPIRQLAQSLACKVIDGSVMFRAQAQQQQVIWQHFLTLARAGSTQ